MSRHDYRGGWGAGWHDIELREWPRSAAWSTELPSRDSLYRKDRGGWFIISPFCSVSWEPEKNRTGPARRNGAGYATVWVVFSSLFGCGSGFGPHPLGDGTAGGSNRVLLFELDLTMRRGASPPRHVPDRARYGHLKLRSPAGWKVRCCGGGGGSQKPIPDLSWSVLRWTTVSIRTFRMVISGVIFRALLDANQQQWYFDFF